MPVDIASGTVRLEYDDIDIPGKVALIWERRYSTAALGEAPTALGLGWTCRYFATLTKHDEGYDFLSPEGAIESFPDPENSVEQGGVIRNFGAYLEVFKAPQGYSPQGYSPQGYSPQGYSPQGYSPQGYSPQGYSPQGYSPQGYSPQGYIVQSWDVETGEIIRYCFRPGPMDTPWQLASIEDETGQGLDLRWNGSQLVAIKQRLEQRTLLLNYNPQRLIDSITLQASSGKQYLLVRYDYDAHKRQIAAYDAAGSADSYDYDEFHRVQREYVKDGGVFSYRYDDQGRCIHTTGLEHYQEKYLRFYDAISFTEVTDSYGCTSRYQHLESGQIVREIDPLGNEKTTDYDAHGRIIAKTDASGAATTYSYDDYGNRASITDALGNTYTLRFNAQHLAESVTDPSGHEWQRIYNRTNQTIGIVDPLGNRWTIQYDASGNMSEIQNPTGARRFHHCTLGLIATVVDWMGNTTRFRYDDFGRVIERTGALGEITRFEYDILGNPVVIMLPDGAILRATYDSVGNLTSYADGNGDISRFVYGPCERLLEVIDPNGGTVRYAWGSEPDRLEQIINEKGETYTFNHNEAGAIVHEIAFDGIERYFQHNAEGYVTAYINGNGEQVNIKRDALHRVIELAQANGEQTSFTYDPLGNLTRAINSDCAVVLERDPLGRICREAQNDHWIESQYDALGNRSAITTSLGHTVKYELNANGFAKSLMTNGDQTLVFERNAYGQETLRQMSDAVIMAHRYDDLGRMIEQQIGPGRMDGGTNASLIPIERPVIRRRYTYDQNSSVISIVDNRWGRTEFDYDPAERLLQALREQGPNEVFRYDATGNISHIQTQDTSSGEEALLYGIGDRLLQKGSTYYEYDAEGRRIKKTEATDNENPQVWLYEWNSLDRLIAVTRPDGTVWQYKYDALGRRVEKTGPETQQQFLWDKDLIVHHLEKNLLLSTWIFDASSFTPLATIQSDQLYSIITDHLGSPRELLDPIGKIALSISTTSWGENFAEDNNSASRPYCPIRFQGQWWDKEIELAYNRYRYYDPTSGSFISQDPIRLLGGTNFYSYAPNPIAWIDPLGLVNAPASLPNEPGIYVVTNGNTSYVGSAGMGSAGDGTFKQGMYDRLSASSDPGQALLGKPGTVVKYIKVDLGTATNTSERNNILRYYEAREYDKEVVKGQTILNKNRPQSTKKTEKAEGLIKKHGVYASSRRSTCR